MSLASAILLSLTPPKGRRGAERTKVFTKQPPVHLVVPPRKDLVERPGAALRDAYALNSATTPPVSPGRSEGRSRKTAFGVPAAAHTASCRSRSASMKVRIRSA